MAILRLALALALALACCMSMGDQSNSTKSTWLAAVSVMPTPAAWIEPTKTRTW